MPVAFKKRLRSREVRVTSRGLHRTLLAIAGSALVACGPALTSPGAKNVSGKWSSAGPAAGLTNITVQLTQAADGAITGTYQATGTAGMQFCPATGACLISGTLGGSNTVLQVFFEMRDAGQFSGQLLDTNVLQGAMSRTEVTQPITFSRVP